MVDFEDYICTTCGNLVKPKTNTKGNFWLEVLLWMLFILPGLFYSLSRLGNKVYACPVCGSETVIPIDTPVGQTLYKKFKISSDNIKTNGNIAEKEKPVSLMYKAIVGIVIVVLLYILLFLLFGKW